MLRIVLVVGVLMVTPSVAAVVPITFEAYAGDVTVSTPDCAEHVAARLDVAFAVPGVHDKPAWLDFRSNCSEPLLLRAQESADGGWILADLRGEWAGGLYTNAEFPVGNGSFTLWLDLAQPAGPRVHAFGDYLLPAEPFSEPIPDGWR